VKCSCSGKKRAARREQQEESSKKRAARREQQEESSKKRAVHGQDSRSDFFEDWAVRRCLLTDNLEDHAIRSAVLSPTTNVQGAALQFYSGEARIARAKHLVKPTESNTPMKHSQNAPEDVPDKFFHHLHPWKAALEGSLNSSQNTSSLMFIAQIHHTHAIDLTLDGKPRAVTTSSQACMSDVFMLLSASLGAVAQLGARLNGIQKVKGSNPFSSTT
jgi:hypothetical protein